MAKVPPVAEAAPPVVEAVELPVIEDLVVEVPPIEEPELPVLEEPVVEAPVIEEPELLVIEEPVVEAPVIEEPELPVIEEPVVEAPPVEAVEFPVIEEPVVEVPPVEAVEFPAIEEPVVEAPPVEAVEFPAIEEPMVEAAPPVAEVVEGPSRVDELEAQLGARPRDYGSRLELARLHRDEQDWKAALTQYEKLVSARKLLPEVRGDLEAMVEGDVARAQVYQLLGDIDMQQDQLDSALEMYRLARKSLTKR